METEEPNPSGWSIAADVGLGAAEGIGLLLYETGKMLVLSSVTFGAYGTLVLASAIEEGYKDGGVLGAGAGGEAKGGNSRAPASPPDRTPTRVSSIGLYDERTAVTESPRIA